MTIKEMEAEEIMKELKTLAWQLSIWPNKPFNELAEDALRRKETIFKDTYVIEDLYTLYQHELILSYINSQKSKSKKKGTRRS
jgi:hypothetical protein